MSEQTTLAEWCPLCGHRSTRHEKKEGEPFCRSVATNRFLPCRDCRHLVGEEHVNTLAARRAVMRREDSPDAAAWAAYQVVYDMAREALGPSWQAFFTDLHQSSLAAGLVAYERARLEQARAHVARAGELSWDDWATLLGAELDKMRRARARWEPEVSVADEAVEARDDARRAVEALQAVLAIVAPLLAREEGDDVSEDEWSLARRVVQAVGDRLIPG